MSIQELAELVSKTVHYQGEILLDPSKSDGAMRKLLNVSRIGTLEWKAKTALGAGLGMAYEDYLTELA